jgi:cell wall-associated NlpC family hydrolase
VIDPRLTPARSDLAAAKLKGQVNADRFVDGVRKQMTSGVSPLRETPSHFARLETQLLLGETFDVYDERDGWAWGQNIADGYVGYVEAKDLSADVIAPTHRVGVLRTIVFPEPDIKSTPLLFASLNAKVRVTRTEGRFAEIGGAYAIAQHLRPMNAFVSDWVASAELFLRVPYLWGGKDSLGLDCSGLVQTALETGGVNALRNADMQETSLGRDIPPDSTLQRGDLVFWDGHVAIARNESELLHANALHMMTAIEAVTAAFTRIGQPRTIKRL